MSSPPFKVKAVYEYTSPHDDDLHFPYGQIITVTEEEDDDWYSGEYVDANGVKQEGIFPKNFVEKYEPTAPPRPTRTNRPKKEAEHAPEPAAEPAYVPEPIHELEQELELEEIHEAPAARAPPPLSPEPQKVTSPPPPKSVEVSPPPVAKPALSASKPAPPPVSEKPSSFKDRIAAFNKAAPPPAPFKPGGLGSGSGGGGANYSIKKSFVAPPPSKNAYIPPPTREMAPQKIYRREEDPEIAASQAETHEQAEKAGLVPGGNEGEEEDQPKPTSLKDRIALLQKQQMEQAARHAEAAQKKEKPKKPAKKRTESHGGNGEGEEEGAELERKATGESKPSMDSVREVPRRRKSSRGAAELPPRKSFGDGNEADMSGAGDTTEDPQDIDDSDEKPRTRAPPNIPMRTPTAPTHEPEVGEEEGATEEEAPQGGTEQEEEDEEDEEEDIDPEVRRKEELRARMAKMSGGMGMHGMFGAMPMPGPMAPPKKKKSTSDKRPEQEEVSSPTSRAPPVPMPGIALPGLSRVRSPEETDRQLGHQDAPAPISSRPADDESEDEEEESQERSAPPPVPSDGAAPPIPGGRPAPPPVPLASARPAPPMSPSAGYESDDEQPPHPPARTQTMNLASPTGEAPRPPQRTSTDGPGSPKSPNIKRASYFGATEQQISPTSPTTPGANKRNSRLPPPIPGAAPLAQNRAPPPPPPTGPAPISRTATGDNSSLQSPRHAAPEPSDEEVTEYEGDYDTDIASAVPHKDALKAHARDSSLDDTPVSSPPPLPSAVAPRAVPPPLPSQPPPNARQSADMRRAAPPPPPPGKMPAPWEQDDNDYDPYKYTANAAPKLPTIPAVSGGLNFDDTERPEEDDIYGTSPPRTYVSPPQDRPAPPPPPRDEAPPPNNRAPPRKSVEVSRSATIARRSVELGRMSMDSGYVANDVDLAPRSFWWTQPRGVPPIFQGRRDILLEFEESSQVKRGKSVVVKELYVLFQDYSQTIITATFAAEDPADIKLEQRHEQPPARSRQDQLEQAHEQFGRRISDAVHTRKETIVGDGTPQGLVNELLKPLSSALLRLRWRVLSWMI
ncbi:related to myosin tail region-interacting protein MTI1 [Phialocephala subalpina]|uniref:Related to myosin tail region-interacting protein MTI1 n=1 Tax=Phialocephala subalpina TaxID=576137 RepID=A0A1L7XIH5_9HELO|nr:related to myosin tail region-interacting protein MTI1 [Phialocephala subalpina]